jgi:hypothetical protein
MQTVRFIAFLFYHYYNGGKNKVSIPYFRTLSSLVMLGFLHFVQVICLFDQRKILTGTYLPDILKFCLILLPLYVIFYVIVPQGILYAIDFEEAKIKRGKRILIVYIVTSLLATAIIGYFKITIK